MIQCKLVKDSNRAREAHVASKVAFSSLAEKIKTIILRIILNCTLYFFIIFIYPILNLFLRKFVI